MVILTQATYATSLASVIRLAGLIPLVCGEAREPKQYKALRQTKPLFGVAFLLFKIYVVYYQYRN